MAVAAEAGRVAGATAKVLVSVLIHHEPAAAVGTVAGPRPRDGLEGEACMRTCLESARYAAAAGCRR